MPNCHAEDESVFSEWLNRKNKNVTSPDIQNVKEIVLRTIAGFIKIVKFHSIKVDGTSDVSNKSKPEDFLGLHEMEKTDATSLANFIKDIIFRLDFDIEQLRDQCYDNCAAMLWEKKEVATCKPIYFLPITTCTC